MSEAVLIVVAGITAGLAVAAVGGLLLGAFFFGGLWWTTHRAAGSPRPAAWIGASLLLRVGIALAGFHLLGGLRWERWLACLVAFALARTAAARWARPPHDEARHAPQP